MNAVVPRRSTVADLLVLGAGPVGLTLAHLAARSGLRVVVLERRQEPVRREPRAVSLDDECLRIWQTCGLDDFLREDWAGGAEGDCICEYLDARDRPFLRLYQRTSDLGYPHATTIHQGRIDEKLLRSAERHPFIEVRRGHAVRAVAQDPQSATAIGSDAQGQSFRATAPWMVACDGSASTVRGLLGIEWTVETSTNPWLVANLVDPAVAEGRDPGHVVIRCHRDRAAVTMPLPHGLRRVEVELPGDDDASWMNDERAIRTRLLRGWDGALEAPIATVARCRFRAASAQRWRDRRIFLAGDAAHVMPPFAGQGLCAGLRDASNLSFKIAGVSQGWLRPSVLDSYEIERRPHVERITRLSCRLGRLMSSSSSFRGALITATLRVVGALPALGSNWLLRGPSIRPRLRRGFLDPTSTQAGQYLPQPIVRGPDGRAVRLDELLGRRMTWIVLVGPGRARLQAPRLHPCDTVLMEGRDFRDAEGVLARRYGAGSMVLVRPDRVVHSHVSPGRLRFSHSPQDRSDFPCHTDVNVAVS